MISSKKYIIMINIVLILCVYINMVFAQQGIYLEQRIESEGDNLPQPMNSITKSWITDDKIRIEQPGQVLLIRFDQEKIYTVMQDNKKFMEMSFSDMEQIIQLSNAFMTNQKNIPSFKKSGKTKKIQSWTAYQIISHSEEQKTEIWLTEEIKIDHNKIIKMYNKMPGLSALSSSLEKVKEFKGFPVLFISDMNVMGMGVRTKIELQNIKKMKMEKSLFELPTDYEEIENPFKNSKNN